MTKVIHKKLRGDMGQTLGRANSRIYIDPTRHRTAKQYLDTCIHEKLHLMFPEMSETEVRRRAKDLREFLWGLGFRQVKQ